MDSLVKGFTTKIVHNDRQDAIEHGSLHKPIHANVAYGYADAKELAAVFQGEKSGYSYGRQVNPTITALRIENDGDGRRHRQRLFCYRHGGHWNHNVLVAARWRSFGFQRLSLRQYQQPF
jgi:hypothetical protein